MLDATSITSPRKWGKNSKQDNTVLEPTVNEMPAKAASEPTLSKAMLDLAKIELGNFCLVVGRDDTEDGLVQGALDAKASVTMVNCPVLKNDLPIQYRGNFFRLGFKPDDFDRILLTPPKDKNEDTRYLEQCIKLLSPGGTLVALMQPNPQRTAFRRLVHGREHEITGRSDGTMLLKLVK